MDTATMDRPRFELEDIYTRNHWVLQAVEDLNADALQAVCRDCWTSLSWGQWLNTQSEDELLRCHSCSAELMESGCKPAPEALVGELQRPGYFDRTWYHATTDPNWVSSVRNAKGGKLLVHAGSKLAASARADYIEAIDPRADIYLHSFSLSDSSKFCTTLLKDMVNSRHWQQTLDVPRPLGLAHIAGQGAPSSFVMLSEEMPGAGYYNTLELPGDVSIIFHAGLIDLDSVETEELLIRS